MVKSIASKKFDKYVQRAVRQGASMQQVAEHLQLDRTTLWHLRKDMRTPGLKMAYRIERLCKIKCQDWFKT